MDCAHCSSPVKQKPGAINRAQRCGLPIYCDRICSGLGRRKHKSLVDRKAEKCIYDAQYRAAHLEEITAKKAWRHKSTYDPVAAAVVRKRRMPLHIEYCRQPQYRAYKKGYDSNRRAAEYGPYAEAFQILLAIESEVKSRASNYEINLTNETLNKSLKRKRAYVQITNDQSRHQQHTYRH